MKLKVAATKTSKEKEVRRIKSSLQFVIDQAQTALGNFNDGDYDGAISELENVREDADYLASDIEAINEQTE